MRVRLAADPSRRLRAIAARTGLNPEQSWPNWPDGYAWTTPAP
ncbi:hypothetical protein QFZ75_008121 [Streptomyces sp. V3I8]|nr:hypothetical protein [Streptomyces sp. V3I8]MDQ1041619.1 hypothetical protein [Streptomyces sp. V3I8]